MNELATTIVAALIAGGAALIGAYLGTRWAFGRFLQERRFEELVLKRNVLRDFLGDATDFNTFYDNCAKGEIDKGLGNELLRRLDRLNTHFVNYPRIDSICTTLDRFIGFGFDGNLSYSEHPLVGSEFDKLQEILGELEGGVQGKLPPWWKFWK